MSATPRSRDEVVADLLAFAEAAEIEADRGERPGEVVLVLPGDKKLKTVLSMVVGERDVSASAFVVRNPDENHLEVYRFLLRRNLRTPGLAYAIDSSGDVFVVGRLPLAALDDEALDRFLGVVLDAADSTFNDLLALGFFESIKREWAWRTSRGESRRNLEAFAHLLESPEDASETTEPAAPTEPTQSTGPTKPTQPTPSTRPTASPAEGDDPGLPPASGGPTS